MQFDIVSLVYNREKDVLQLLESIKTQKEFPAKVWLIDNGSEKRLEVDKTKYPFPLEIFRIEKNVGISGYNKGFELSSADYVIAVDSDVVLETDTVASFKSAVQSAPDLAIAGAKILDATSKQPMPDNPIHGSKELSGGGRQMVQFNGCCFMARRKDFLNFGGFDPRLYIYVNEWDFTLRAFSSLRPEQIRYYPHITAFHKTAPSKDRSDFYTVLVRRNEFWVRWKYYPLSSALDYTVRFYLGSIRKMILGGRSCFSLYGSYLLKATMGLPSILKDRKRVPREIFDRLMAMRSLSKPPENLVDGY